MRLPFEKISVVGLGYIGLPTAVIMASHGLQVVGVDVNANAVAGVNDGHAHFVEPELDAVLQAVVASGRLRATTQPEAAEVFIIAVPTPLAEDKRPDVSYVTAAGSAIAPVLEKGSLVILESTSPVGTTEQLAAQLAQARPDLTFPQTAGEKADVLVAHCPERVLPGRILRELVENDRIIGGLSRASARAAKTLYQIFVRGECFITDVRTAELAKLTENAFRDVNIAFANELSLICDRLGIDVWELIKLANRHPRVNILRPGPGVGGHCIAVDPWFIVASAPQEARLIRTAREVNDSKPLHVVAAIMRRAERFKDPVIACLGLAFKADVDDLRESPAMEIVHHLATAGVDRLLVVEPHIEQLPHGLRSLAPKVALVDLPEALARADIVVLLVDHRFFQDIEPQMLREKIVIDTRGVWR
ncbi:MAG: UDP-N-acetyl-D-mannosamine dehydrogenase [Planctomycetota bacterium]|nr:UDP-N-acetyl-D-mannosamine dehydrogenase [Planctomycetota bacterium]